MLQRYILAKPKNKELNQLIREGIFASLHYYFITETANRHLLIAMI